MVEVVVMMRVAREAILPKIQTSWARQLLELGVGRSDD